MKELKQTVIHHIEQAAIKAGVRFDFDCRRELEADFEAAEARIAALEQRVAHLDTCRQELLDGGDGLARRVGALENPRADRGGQ